MIHYVDVSVKPILCLLATLIDPVTADDTYGRGQVYLRSIVRSNNYWLIN